MSDIKNQSAKKAQAVVEKFYKESGAEDNVNFTSTVNWATAEEVEDLRKPNNEDRYKAISEKITEPVSDVEIIIPKEKNRLNLIFRNSLNLRDMGNPMFGEEDRSNRKQLISDINDADIKNNHVCLVYAGDLIGTEWELKHLRNAQIIKTPNEQGQKIAKALFFSLNERKKALIRDVKFALNSGVEVYLMNGNQEHKANKYFKIDILQEVVDEVSSDSLHYIKGVNTIVNVAKQLNNGQKRYSTIGFQTNNSMSKAQGGQQVVSAVKRNSGINQGKVVFVSNTNTAGKKDTNTYYVSGQATFKNTSRGHAPKASVKSYNVFSLSIPKAGEITVIQGSNMPRVKILEKLVYDEYVKTQYIEQVINENVSRQIKEFTRPERYVENDFVKTLQYVKSRNRKEESDSSEDKEEKESTKK